MRPYKRIKLTAVLWIRNVMGLDSYALFTLGFCLLSNVYPRHLPTSGLYSAKRSNVVHSTSMIIHKMRTWKNVMVRGKPSHWHMTWHRHSSLSPSSTSSSLSTTSPSNPCFRCIIVSWQYHSSQLFDSPTGGVGACYLVLEKWWNSFAFMQKKSIAYFRKVKPNRNNWHRRW